MEILSYRSVSTPEVCYRLAEYVLRLNAISNITNQ